MGLLSRVRGRLSRLCGGSRAAPSAPAVLAERSANELHASELLEAALDEHPVVLFLRGTPEAPTDADAREIVALLAESGLAYAHVDCNAHEEMWQCLKDVTGTPEFPLLCAHGKPVGGLARLRELRAAGELAAATRG